MEEAADFHQDHGHAERGPGQPVFGREHPHEEEEQPGPVQRDVQRHDLRRGLVVDPRLAQAELDLAAHAAPSRAREVLDLFFFNKIER